MAHPPRTAKVADEECQVTRGTRDPGWTPTGVPRPARESDRSMTVTKPLLLLDVDGALCPKGSAPGEPMRTLVIDGWPIVFSERLPARLSRLAEHFTLVWATSWEHAANRALAPALGLPELAFVSFAGASARRGRTWKLAAVKRFVGDRPVAWVDDELGGDAHSWAAARSQPTLLLDVNPSWGFVESHVDLLLAFAAHIPDTRRRSAARRARRACRPADMTATSERVRSMRSERLAMSHTAGITPGSACGGETEGPSMFVRSMLSRTTEVS
jgi:hypothetical protein